MNKSPAAGATETVDSEIAGRILKALKDKRGFTQESLAQDIGISHSTLRRSLDQSRGDRRSFSILDLGKIATVLNIHPSTLLPASLTDVAA
ncbi:MAG: helix-turn-helix domain-containing protein [Actinomycetota bacterium]|nr:helix-turn-helix domain-containing protein [Actinomycetota bacterium]